MLHAPGVREALPLSLHHLPLAVTFALFEVRPGWAVSALPYLQGGRRRH